MPRVHARHSLNLLLSFAGEPQAHRYVRRRRREEIISRSILMFSLSAIAPYCFPLWRLVSAGLTGSRLAINSKPLHERNIARPPHPSLNLKING
jgi:hypothetical protein